MKPKKRVSQIEALQRLQRYCAYQERCHKEVRSKLLDLGIYGDALEEIISELIQDGFLNEERFACSFARGKFHTRKWGRKKIIQELKKRDISEYCRRKALEEIEEQAYRQALRELLEKKHQNIKEESDFKRKGKLANYALRKGYEPELVWQMIEKIFR